MAPRSFHGPLLLGCAAMGSSCSETLSLDWRLSFSSTALRERAAVVEASILEGSCESENAVYRARFDPDESPRAPPALAAGRYGFFARVRDSECRWYASGCAQRRLPLDRDGSVVVELTPQEPVLDCVACSSASCSPGPAEAGIVDAGIVDAGHEPAPSADPVTLRFEAEEADPLLGPFQVHDDEVASGGRYVAYLYDETLPEPITTFRRSEPPGPDGEGIGRFVFEIETPGDYRLWARVITPTLDEDSFWFRMDEGEWVLWNDVAHSDAWAWVDVRAFDSRTEMLLFPLEPGVHTLLVGYRELNAKLDVLLMTNDLSSIPAP